MERVSFSMGELLLDIALPKTDQGVFIQWAIAAAVWPVALFFVRKASKDVRTFVIGLAVLNLAWFAARTIH